MIFKGFHRSLLTGVCWIFCASPLIAKEVYDFPGPLEERVVVEAVGDSIELKVSFLEYSAIPAAYSAGITASEIKFLTIRSLKRFLGFKEGEKFNVKHLSIPIPVKRDGRIEAVVRVPQSSITLQGGAVSRAASSAEQRPETKTPAPPLDPQSSASASSIKDEALNAPVSPLPSAPVVISNQLSAKLRPLPGSLHQAVPDYILKILLMFEAVKDGVGAPLGSKSPNVTQLAEVDARLSTLSKALRAEIDADSRLFDSDRKALFSTIESETINVYEYAQKSLLN